MVVRSLPRLATVLAIATSLVIPASAALAQDDPVTEADIFMPASVMGQPLETTVVPGPALVASIDPDDPESTRQLEELEALLREAGASIEQLHIGSGQAVTEDDDIVVIAIRVEGLDMAEAMEPWLQFLASGFYEVVETSAGEIGGKQVTVVVDGDYPFEDPPRSFAYAAGDTLWFVGGSEPWAEEAIAALPA